MWVFLGLVTFLRLIKLKLKESSKTVSSTAAANEFSYFLELSLPLDLWVNLKYLNS